MYQKQRSLDDFGRLIADFREYAMAFQLIEESFRESLDEGKRYTDERFKIIGRHGKQHIQEFLSGITGVTGIAVSQWMKHLETGAKNKVGGSRKVYHRVHR